MRKFTKRNNLNRTKVSVEIGANTIKNWFKLHKKKKLKTKETRDKSERLEKYNNNDDNQKPTIGDVWDIT